MSDIRIPCWVFFSLLKKIGMAFIRISKRSSLSLPKISNSATPAKKGFVLGKLPLFLKEKSSMKRYLFISILAGSALLGACQKEHHEGESKEGAKHKAQEEAALDKLIGEAVQVPGQYGQAIDAVQAISLDQLVTELERAGTYQGKIRGEIKEACTKKGCWISMELPGGEHMRVTFKDYGFFVPTNSQGFPIVLEGVATFTETDVETLKHFAEDQGKSQEEIDQIMSPKRELTFEASGVVILEKT